MDVAEKEKTDKTWSLIGYAVLFAGVALTVIYVVLFVYAGATDQLVQYENPCSQFTTYESLKDCVGTTMDSYPNQYIPR
jgi:hypothetical protein